ncbi:hypothetical protein NP284_16190 [Rhodopseudomonas pseudopalustris]
MPARVDLRRPARLLRYFRHIDLTIERGEVLRYSPHRSRHLLPPFMPLAAIDSPVIRPGWNVQENDLPGMMSSISGRQISSQRVERHRSSDCGRTSWTHRNENNFHSQIRSFGIRTGDAVSGRAPGNRA